MSHDASQISTKKLEEVDSADTLAVLVEAVIMWAKNKNIPSVTVSDIRENHALNYMQAKLVFDALSRRFPVTGQHLLFAKSRGHYAHGELFYC